MQSVWNDNCLNCSRRIGFQLNAIGNLHFALLQQVCRKNESVCDLCGQNDKYHGLFFYSSLHFIVILVKQELRISQDDVEMEIGTEKLAPRGKYRNGCYFDYW